VVEVVGVGWWLLACFVPQLQWRWLALGVASQ